MSVKKCLVDEANINFGEDSDPIGKLYCDHMKKQIDCWKMVTNKIDECIPERGTSVSKIYITLLEVTCTDRGNFNEIYFMTFIFIETNDSVQYIKPGNFQINCKNSVQANFAIQTETM